MKLGEKSQRDRFLEMARRVGADESAEAFESKLRRIASVKPKKRKGRATKARRAY